tara:strand:+ start:183 stop:647 length:465 start_codon:yes stop_codon:yes gene_type:complete
MKIDKIDKQILNIIQKNASMPLSEISKRVGISSTPCWNRIKKMEEEKIIKSRVTIIDNKKVNLPLIAFLSIHVPNHTDEWRVKFEDLIESKDQIIETHRISGSHDYILKILSPSIEEYDLFQQKFIRESGCTNMQTSFSQKEIKNNKNIPLDFL